MNWDNGKENGNYYLGFTGSMLEILYTVWGMGFLTFKKKGSFFLPKVMLAKFRARVHNKAEDMSKHPRLVLGWGGGLRAFWRGGVTCPAF